MWNPIAWISTCLQNVFLSAQWGCEHVVVSMWVLLYPVPASGFLLPISLTNPSSLRTKRISLLCADSLRRFGDWSGVLVQWDRLAPYSKWVKSFHGLFLAGGNMLPLPATAFSGSELPTFFPTKSPHFPFPYCLLLIFLSPKTFPTSLISPCLFSTHIFPLFTLPHLLLRSSTLLSLPLLSSL